MAQKKRCYLKDNSAFGSQNTFTILDS